MNTIGDRIKELRKENKLTQQELGGSFIALHGTVRARTYQGKQEEIIGLSNCKLWILRGASKSPRAGNGKTLVP